MEKDEIVEAFKLSRIDKVWKDPHRAKNWGEMGWMLFTMVLIAFLIIAWFDLLDIDYESKGSIELDEFKHIAYNNMDCSALKQTLLDVEALPYTSLAIDLQSQILARC